MGAPKKRVINPEQLVPVLVCAPNVRRTRRTHVRAIPVAVS
jgi:hypothetical protein